MEAKPTCQRSPCLATGSRHLPRSYHTTIPHYHTTILLLPHHARVESDLVAVASSGQEQPRPNASIHHPQPFPDWDHHNFYQMLSVKKQTAFLHVSFDFGWNITNASSKSDAKCLGDKASAVKVLRRPIIQISNSSNGFTTLIICHGCNSCNSLGKVKVKSFKRDNNLNFKLPKRIYRVNHLPRKVESKSRNENKSRSSIKANY